MFTVGDKVVCRDGKFPLGIENLYVALPKEGQTYTVRAMSVGVGIAPRVEGEICVLLQELVNPKGGPNNLERGFKEERFIKPETEEETAGVDAGQSIPIKIHHVQPA